MRHRMSCWYSKQVITMHHDIDIIDTRQHGLNEKLASTARRRCNTAIVAVVDGVLVTVMT